MLEDDFGVFDAASTGTTTTTMQAGVKTLPPVRSPGKRDGWDSNYFPNTSTDSLPTTAVNSDGPLPRIIRRYRFNESRPGTKSVDKRLPQLSHFDVRVGKLSFSSTPSAPFLDTASTVPSKCDYLRVYYSDFLSQHPTEDADKPKYSDVDESTIESEELQKWILDSHPRSRTETYPLYLLTKDVLRRVSASKCKIINTTMDKLREQLAALQGAIHALARVCVCAHERLRETLRGNSSPCRRVYIPCLLRKAQGTQTVMPHTLRIG